MGLSTAKLFEIRQREQWNEINSPLNRWGAGRRFGHSPSDLEAAQHYRLEEAPARFAQKWEQRLAEIFGNSCSAA